MQSNDFHLDSFYLPKREHFSTKYLSLSAIKVFDNANDGMESSARENFLIQQLLYYHYYWFHVSKLLNIYLSDI